MQQPFDALRAGYTALLQQMRITRSTEVDAVAYKLLRFVAEGRYADVSVKTGVPQIVMATSFEREASSNFRLSPAQGDPWDEVSRHVPRGRGPFPNWAAAAEDAYHIDHLDSVGAANWSWERAAYEEELFNGFGYRSHGIHTPYLWSGTNIYTRGKYVADGEFSYNAIDAQLGVIPVMVRMVELQPSLALPYPLPGSSLPALQNNAPAAISPPASTLPSGLRDAAMLQHDLNLLGADPQLDIDNNYGRLTRRAVTTFQQAHGLDVDGIAGPETWSAINKALRGRAA